MYVDSKIVVIETCDGTLYSVYDRDNVQGVSTHIEMKHYKKDDGFNDMVSIGLFLGSVCVFRKKCSVLDLMKRNYMDFSDMIVEYIENGSFRTAPIDFNVLLLDLFIFFNFYCDDIIYDYNSRRGLCLTGK